MRQELHRSKSHEWDKYERVIVFDGVCNVCNASVNFVMARDPDRKFRFGTLQSEAAQQVLKELEVSTEDFETFLLLEGDRVFTKSTAALRVVRQLGSLWPLLYALMIIPRPIRDAFYDAIARNRYHWMGKSETCRVPTPTDRERFV